jgi:site-specific recombinase XerD
MTQSDRILSHILPDLSALPGWQRALELWLGSRRSENTRRAYAGALRDLLIHSGRAVYEISRTDVAAWAEGMRGRGLAESTVQMRVSGVSSFYRYALEECELAGRHPAGGESLRRRVEPYGKAAWLSAEEARALLAVPDRATVRGRRNFALLAGYLLLGRRNSEWRCVRWGDLERRTGLTWQYRWSGKGKVDQRADLPAPVIEAVTDYLHSADRRLSADDYVFEGQPGKPLDSATVRKMVKVCARHAGLDPARIRVHTLRHTAAMLRKEAGDSLEQIMGLLVHSSLAVTQIYLHSLEGRKDSSWGTVAQMLGI